MTANPTPLDTCSPFEELNAHGLNLQAVFNLADLPCDVLAALPVDAFGPYRQLLLIGHLGGLLWRQLALAGMEDAHPVDSFARSHVTAWLAHQQRDLRYRFVYPGPTSVGLQRLGQLAGWHHSSPFMVGVNAAWGSWFAYRAVVLADTRFAATKPLESPSPCNDCAARPCVSRCPAGALDAPPNGSFNLSACLAYRHEPQSACQDRCLARNACPAGQEHRYSDAQISYHYGQSMAVTHAIRSREN